MIFILILGLILQPLAAFVTPFMRKLFSIGTKINRQSINYSNFVVFSISLFVNVFSLFSLFVSNFGENSTMVLEKSWKSENITERCTDAQIDGKTNRQSDRWMDEQTKDNRWPEKLFLPNRLGELKYQHEQYITWKSIDFFNRWNCKRVCIIKK